MLNAKTEAQIILKEIWKDRGFPVDPVIIANELGIQVIMSDLPNEIAGAIVKKSDQNAVILLNQKDKSKIARRRFTCAHELGHFVARQQQQNDNSEYEYIDLRDSISSLGCSQDEVFANQFAANLLMPEEQVKEFHHEGLNLIIMAYKFGVSEEAMKYRLKNLKIFT